MIAVGVRRSNQQGNHFACAPPEWPATRERERGLAHPSLLLSFSSIRRSLTLSLSLSHSLSLSLRSNRRKRDKDEGNFQKQQPGLLKKRKTFYKNVGSVGFPGGSVQTQSGVISPAFRVDALLLPRSEESAWVKQAADSEQRLVN